MVEVVLNERWPQKTRMLYNFLNVTGAPQLVKCMIKSLICPLTSCGDPFCRQNRIIAFLSHYTTKNISSATPATLVCSLKCSPKPENCRRCRIHSQHLLCVTLLLSNNLSNNTATCNIIQNFKFINLLFRVQISFSTTTNDACQIL